MTRTTETNAVADRYLAVWSEVDPQARRRAVEALWAPDGVEFIEGVRFRGHDALDARIAEACKEFVESGKYAVTSAGDTTCHGDIVTFTIQLTPTGADGSGELAWAARVFLVLGVDGLIREDYQLTVKPLAV